MSPSANVAAFLLLASSVSTAPTARAQESAPEAAPLEFVDVRFARRTLDDFGPRRAFVLYFTTDDCPLAPRYVPRLNELAARFAASGVQFAAVDEGLRDTVPEMASFALEHSLTFPIVKDADGSVARALGATRAGEVALVDAKKRLRYRGRVDGQYRVGGEAPAGRADLAKAIEELLAGKEVSVPRTVAEGCALPAAPPPRVDLTFGKDVAPVLARRCVACHKDGGAAPFPLVDYGDAVDHSAALAEAVALGRMPPWHASDAYGKFSNRIELTEEERAALLDWARGERKPGDLSLVPPPPPADDSPWRIGTPDLVLETPTEMQLPADGIVDYQYMVLLPAFAEETWVQAVQIVPRNRRAMHHCNLAFVRLGEEFKTENFVTGQVPGGDPLVLDDGTAVCIPKGALLGLQIHYVTTGREETDRISVGLRFPRARVQRRMRHVEMADLRFAIPPGADAHPVSAARTLDRDAIGIGMYVHMHVRGRDMRFTATEPDGAPRTLLLVPTYDFDWQQSYRWFPEAERFAKGTRIDCLAHFDNSRFNPFNPDPGATVRFGLQTAQEMMYGFLFYVDAHERLELDVDPKTGRALAR
ncbi:MAG TPA: redoxin domain-containing protein [Planctomycetota bacterium]|jgi:peroxiredoxin/mono/diheme cytochrome c family protein|nr:redoxin domain-containing protein [Planctomycetota bacterium]